MAKGIKYTSQINMLVPPTEDNHVIRKQELDEVNSFLYGDETPAPGNFTGYVTPVVTPMQTPEQLDPTIVPQAGDYNWRLPPANIPPTTFPLSNQQFRLFIYDGADWIQQIPNPPYITYIPALGDVMKMWSTAQHQFIDNFWDGTQFIAGDPVEQTGWVNKIETALTGSYVKSVDVDTTQPTAALTIGKRDPLSGLNTEVSVPLPLPSRLPDMIPPTASILNPLVDSNSMNAIFAGVTALPLNGAMLTRAINGITQVAKNLFPIGTVFVEGKTLINDIEGTLGVYDGDSDPATITVRTKTTSQIGTTEPVLLGNVATNADLPLTVSQAETIFGRTPNISDYANVLADETMSGLRVEWYIIDIDGSGNITWGNPIPINTGDYQEQTTAQDAGRVLTGGATAGTFGQSLEIDTAPVQGSNNLLASGGVFAWFGAAVSTLLTTAKTVVGAINELFNTTVKTTGAQNIAGSLNVEGQFNSYDVSTQDLLASSITTNGLQANNPTNAIPMNNTGFSSMKDPVNPQDSANKRYVDNSVLATQPHLWTPNTEINFGDGTFGWRHTGNITIAANTRHQLNSQTPSMSRVINSGGWFGENVQYRRFQLGHYIDANTFSSITVQNPDYWIWTITSAVRNNAPYDIWVRYAKN